MDFPKFPPEFSSQAKAAVIKAEVEASRVVQESLKLLDSPLSRLGHLVGPTNKRGVAFRYVMTVFYSFAKEACNLGMTRKWSVDTVDRASREFLRQTVVHAVFRYAHDIVFPEMTSMGQILPSIQAIFEKSPEWRKYQDDLLAVADSQATMPPEEASVGRKSTSETETTRPYPNRAAWLRERLKERAWNKNDIRRFGGPDRRTIQRVLDGLRVREDGLEQLAVALSKKGGKVAVVEIPSD